jgi:VWFA-related protein
MRVRTAAVTLSVLCVCALTPLRGQTPQQPTFRSSVDLVTVDVTVLSRGGDPLTNLRQDDFTLLIDGKPRPILTFRFLRADAPAAAPEPGQPAPPPAAPPDASQRRVFVLVVDRDHVPAGEGQQMLEAGATFVDALPVSDRLALWVLPDAKDALKFNESREAIKQRLRLAVGTYRPPYGPWMVGRDEAIKVDDNVPGALDAIIARECYKQPQTCPKEVENQVRDVARDARQRADATLASLGNLVDALGQIEGPKHLVLVTGGPVTTLENIRSVTTLGQRAAAARVTIHALQVNLPSYQARTDQMRATPEDINQSASAAYLVAGATGGLTITPTSGETAFSRLARQLSASYVLVFETVAADRDGKEHAVEVKVADRGFGTSVRARTSFRVDPSAQPAAPPAAEPAAAPAPPPPPPEPVGTDPGDMADRLADYAERFEKEVSAVVAEERSVQVIHPWRGQPAPPEKEPALEWVEPGEKSPRTGPVISRRQMIADVLMAQLKDQQWMSYRDVAEVDGTAVRDRTDRVRKLFLSQSPDRFSQFQRIAMESARYNLGDMKRDLNLPTVTLSLLRRVNHPRFEFKRQKDETIDGRLCRVLSYKEKVSPTLISTRNSGDVFLYGRVWLDQADGRVRRTELRFDRGFGGSIGGAAGAGGARSVIRVDYGPLEDTETLVPTQMWEWHESVNQPGRIGGDLTGLQGLATYSKFRRFSVTTTEQIRD